MVELLDKIMAMSPLKLCFAYAFMSVISNISAKNLVSQYHFPSFFLLVTQGLLILLAYPLSNSPISSKILIKSLPISVLFLGNLGLGLIGMKYVSLPMYICIRKMTTLIIYIINSLQGKTSSIGISVGVLFITLGGVIAGINDITGDLFGYCIVLGSVIMNAMQLIYANKLFTQAYNTISIFFCASISLIPVSYSLSSFLEGSVLDLYREISLDSNSLIALLIGCSSSGLANYLMILCTSEISPIATSVSGNFKDIICIIIGIVAFQDVTLTLPFVLGLISSTLGALVYTYCKLQEIYQTDKHD